jgi:hypothetical protein
MLFRVVAGLQAGGMWTRRKERGSARSDSPSRDEYYDAFSAYIHFVLGFLFTFRGPVDQFQKTVEW